MREYKVPFSTKEDEKLVCGMSGRECLWVGSGLVLAVILVAVPAAILELTVIKTLYLLPLGLLPVGAGVYMAFAKIKNFDKYVKADVNIWYKFKYNKQPHGYYQFRR